MNQLGDMPPGEPSQVGLNMENIDQTEEMEISQKYDYQSGDIDLLEQSQDEQPGSLGAETINRRNRTVAPPKKYRSKIKMIRKE